MLIVTNSVIWAKYKRGGYNDDETSRNEHGIQVPLQPFKVLVVNGKQNWDLYAIHGEKWQLTYNGTQKENFIYALKGDTLFVTLDDVNNVTLQCPSLVNVQLLNAGLHMMQMDQPSLHAALGDHCSIFMENNNIGRLDIKGAIDNTVTLEGGKVDTISLLLGKHGKIRTFQNKFKQFDMSVDSLDELSLDPQSIQSLKKIQL
jgi:hypothetical protein